MKTCYLCPRELVGENISEEHIILNSIGGRLTSYELLCKPCNSKLGDSADRELSRQLAPIAGLLMVKGHKKEIQDIKTVITGTDKKVTLKDGYKPVFTNPEFKWEPIDEKQTHLSITTRDEKEMQDRFDGLKKKYKNFDVEESKKYVKHYSEYIDSLTIEMEIGGKIAMRSIVKTAVNYFIHERGNKEVVEHLFKYIKSEEELDMCKHFYPNKSIYKKEPKEMAHILHLVGDKYSKQLYCYVEFFSTYSFIVKLSDNYSGENFTKTYCYDVLKKNKLEKKVTLKLKAIEIVKLFSYTKDEFENIRQRILRTRKIIDQVQNDNALHLLITKSMDKHFVAEGEILTKKMLHDFFFDVSMEFTKMQLRGGKKMSSENILL